MRQGGSVPHSDDHVLQRVRNRLEHARQHQARKKMEAAGKEDAARMQKQPEQFFRRDGKKEQMMAQQPK